MRKQKKILKHLPPPLHILNIAKQHVSPPKFTNQFPYFTTIPHFRMKV